MVLGSHSHLLVVTYMSLVVLVFSQSYLSLNFRLYKKQTQVFCFNLDNLSSHLKHFEVSLTVEEVKLSQACKENQYSRLLTKPCIYNWQPLLGSCSRQPPPLDWNIHCKFRLLQAVNNNLQFSYLKFMYIIIQAYTHNSAINIIGSSGLFSIRRVIASFISLVTPVRAADYMKPKGIL